MSNNQFTGLEIAIIGISSRVSGAADWRQFWQNIAAGKETLRFFSREDLLAAGVDEALIDDPNFVGYASDIKDKDSFDSNFFDYTPDEGRFMNPQNRVLHECTWEALEDAGYDPEDVKGGIGLYAGAFDDFQWRIYSSLVNRSEVIPDFTLISLNNKDTMTNQVSYKLNLTGPSVAVQSSCSSAAVAIHLASRSLLLGETRLALAGGVRLSTTQAKGYLYKEGGVFSKDGHCRAFDKDASGTVGGDGAGVVVLKRLKDALEDRDHIYAVIKGSAISNDGNQKVGFSAPSVDGQVSCIKTAQQFARVSPDSISYIEAHGTGTRLGDPIEVESLNISFNRSKSFSCPIGSVKTNIGHLDAASGLIGVIKTALSLKNRQLPPSINYTTPNPEIDFAGGPFYVNTTLQAWKARDNMPLRAGVNSFGVGGTNAHIILEEAPVVKEGDAHGRGFLLLTLSARTEHSLARYFDKLKAFLLAEPDVDMADMAYTFQLGRRAFEYRRSVVYKDRENLLQALETGTLKEQVIRSREKQVVVFMFPGQGSQYPGMGKDLYEGNAFFRNEIEKGLAVLRLLTGEELRDVLFPIAGNEKKIYETRYTQPLLFLQEYALARLLQFCGITPSCMIGHSLGEYVAACLSGVFSFEDALRLVTARGALAARMEEGAMLSLPITEKEIEPYLDEHISLAAVNGEEQVVVAGNTAAIAMLMDRLNEDNMPFVKLFTSRAFHSSMLDPLLEDFREILRTVTMNEPSLPFISNLTGRLITAEEATSAEYWVQHMRKPVRFAAGVDALLALNKDAVFVEAGPGHTLTSMLKQRPADKVKPVCFNLLRSFKEEENDERYFIQRLGQLWAQGVTVSWKSWYGDEKRRRISLPTYAFEIIRYPTDVNPFEALPDTHMMGGGRKSHKVNDWFYSPQWKQLPMVAGNARSYRNKTVVVFVGNGRLDEQLRELTAKEQINGIFVTAGIDYEKVAENVYTINPGRQQDYERLFEEINTAGCTPAAIFHCWNHTAADMVAAMVMGYESLLHIVRGFTAVYTAAPVQMEVIGAGWYSITGEELLIPARALSLGAVKAIPLEFSNISCRAIDCVGQTAKTIQSLWEELHYVTRDEEVAIRGRNRYVKDFQQLSFELPETGNSFRKKATYLLTGANGGMGKTFALHLARKYAANLILVSRSAIDQAFVSELEQEGVKTFFIQADVTSEALLREQLHIAEEITGPVRGVIHTAGVGDFAGIIIKRTKQEDATIFAPKVSGTAVLKEIFSDRELDFMVHCSSNAASVPLFGQVAYIAANIYQDAVAEYGNASYPVISIEWPTLKETGMAVKAVAHMNHEQKTHVFKDGITPAEAVQVLESALLLKLPVQIVSTTDFAAFAHQKMAARNAEEKETPVQITYAERERPDLSALYKAPETATEYSLAGIVQRLLGLNKVGLDDVFFELGGDSLKGLVLIKRIKKELDVELTLKQFFDNQTVRQMGQLVDEYKLLFEKKERTSTTII